MSENGNGSDEHDPETDPDDERRRGFRLEAGLRPLSDLLGRLVEMNASNVPPPSEEMVEWEAVDEDEAVRRRDASDSTRERKKRTRDRPSDRCLVDMRFFDDEFVVTADIPGARKDDLSIGVDPRTDELVISEDETVIGRVTLPWGSPEATTVWFNNGVLEVRVQPTDA